MVYLIQGEEKVFKKITYLEWVSFSNPISCSSDHWKKAEMVLKDRIN